MNGLEIILSDVSQTEKDKYHMVSLICGIQKKIQMNFIWQNRLRNRFTDLENELMATKGKRKKEEETGSLGLTCTHCYI